MKTYQVTMVITGPTDPLVTATETNEHNSAPIEGEMYKELYMKYNREHRKNGFFVVGWELLNNLYLNLLSHGYSIPNIASIGKHRIRPDKSVQPAFHEFLRERYIDLSDAFVYGELIDEEDTTFRLKHYRNKHMSDFMEFFEEVWLVKHAKKYFRTRDPNALNYLPLLITNTEQKIQTVTIDPTELSERMEAKILQEASRKRMQAA